MRMSSSPDAHEAATAPPSRLQNPVLLARGEPITRIGSLALRLSRATVTSSRGRFAARGGDVEPPSISMLGGSMPALKRPVSCKASDDVACWGLNGG